VMTIDRETLAQPVHMREPNGHATTSTYSEYMITQMYDSTTSRRISYTWSDVFCGPTISKRLITISGDVVRQDFYYGVITGSCPGRWLDSVYVGNTGSYYSPSGGTTVEKHF